MSQNRLQMETESLVGHHNIHLSHKWHWTVSHSKYTLCLKLSRGFACHNKLQTLTLEPGQSGPTLHSAPCRHPALRLNQFFKIIFLTNPKNKDDGICQTVALEPASFTVSPLLRHANPLCWRTRHWPSISNTSTQPSASRHLLLTDCLCGSVNLLQLIC